MNKFVWVDLTVLQGGILMKERKERKVMFVGRDLIFEVRSIISNFTPLLHIFPSQIFYFQTPFVLILRSGYQISTTPIGARMRAGGPISLACSS